jgi:glutathione synthase/RimK-type ligase-like ATP-grasp enzyme
MQLRLAQRLKLQIPETIVTNTLEKAKEFIKIHKNCIIKPISHGLQQRGKTFFSIYTSSIDITKLEKLNLADTFDTPIFLQKRIKNSKDIRVTIVGLNFFSVSIEKKSPEEVDWRKPEVEKIYKQHYLPKELEIQLIKINSQLGLVYSAIDLILTPEGEYVFLEINPVGEWGWLEKEVGLNISGVLINELLCQQ